jgi:sulfofructose kinase
MSPRWDVLGLGAVAVDDLVYVDEYPALDSKAPVQAFRREGGGLAGTALVAATRLGARAAYCGMLGDEELSRFTLAELEREGVDCSPVRSHPDARPFHSVIIVKRPTGQRSILFGGMGVMQVPAEHITDALISDCRVLFVDWTVVESGIQAAELAHRHAIPVVADIEPNTHPHLDELVRQADHLIVGVEMAGQLTHETDPARAVLVLASDGRACSVVTDGKRGCWYAERGGPVEHVPALDVEVVDTTGCGDVFHGAYAACLARGESTAQAMRVATIAAGIKATRHGGRAGIPDRAAVDQILRRWS